MKKGDFVEIEFTGRISATGEIFDLTSEEEAKNEGVHNPKQKYGPILVIIGSGMSVKGVETELEKMAVGEEREFELKPADAFGTRSPKLIKILSIAKFIKKENPINPVPGLFVDIDGKSARIQSVSGGRVRVDFNHPLAGKDVKYRVKVAKHLKTAIEKAEALINYYNIKANVDVKEGNLDIRFETEMPPFMKSLLEKSFKKWIPEIKSAKFHFLKKSKENQQQGKAEQKSENGTTKL